MTAILSPLRRQSAVPGSKDPAEERFVFHGVEWEFYEQVLRAAGERRIFVTYYRGTLEVMSPSYEHGGSAEALARLVRLLGQELRVPHKGAGSTTLRQRIVEAGLEPDHCFYIRNVRAILGKRNLDPDVDPPPDLAIEVEVSKRLGQRISVYEALRVPEVWRYDLERLRVLVLNRGAYVERTHSVAFPTVPLEQVHRFVELSWGMDELEWDEAVRAWVRQNLVKPKGRRRRTK